MKNCSISHTNKWLWSVNLYFCLIYINIIQSFTYAFKDWVRYTFLDNFITDQIKKIKPKKKCDFPGPQKYSFFNFLVLPFLWAPLLIPCPPSTIAPSPESKPASNPFPPPRGIPASIIGNLPLSKPLWPLSQPFPTPMWSAKGTEQGQEIRVIIRMIKLITF